MLMSKLFAKDHNYSQMATGKVAALFFPFFTLKKQLFC